MVPRLGPKVFKVQAQNLDCLFGCDSLFDIDGLVRQDWTGLGEVVRD